MEQVEQLESQKREHPDVNAIRFSGNPRELAQRIRLHLERGGMAFANSKPANERVQRPT